MFLVFLLVVIYYFVLWETLLIKKSDHKGAIRPFMAVSRSYLSVDVVFQDRFLLGKKILLRLKPDAMLPDGLIKRAGVLKARHLLNQLQDLILHFFFLFIFPVAVFHRVFVTP